MRTQSITASWNSLRSVVSITTDPVDLSPLRSSLPRTWIRTLQDVILPPDKQLRFARTAGNCPTVDLDAGHMCMVSQPQTTAALLTPFTT